MNSKRPVILLGTPLLGLSLILLWLLSSTGTGLQISHAAGYDASQNPDYQVIQTIPLDGLVFYYPFLTTAHAAESWYVTPGESVPGGAALEFDGIDDQLNMGTSDALMLSDTSFTVEAWISTTHTNTGWVLGKHDPGWGNGYGLMINHQDCAPNKACFDIAGDHMAAISTSNVNNGQWHHIAGVYDISGTKRIFVDGFLEDSNPASVSIPPNTAPFRVGYVYDDHSREQYKGLIDEVRVWNVARTEAEIRSTMNTSLIGTEPGLVGYWRLDEGSGQTAFDSTAYGNNGQLGSTPGVDDDDPSWYTWHIFPIITSITPNSTAANTGDIPVTISGYNFSTPVSAQLDGVSLLDVDLVSSTTLNAVVPVNSLDVGVYNLVVTSDGVPATLQDAFAVGLAGPWYVAPDGDDGDDCLSPATPCASINGAMNKPIFLTDSTILVAEGTYTGTGDEVVLLNKSVTLSGGWDEAFLGQGGTSTIEGEGARRGIYVDSGVTANVDHFTIQHGYTDDGNGGGIYNSGVLSLTHSTISDSFAEFYGYFGHGGGGIYNIGSLALNNSSISHNTARDGGGGIYATNGSSTVIMDSQIYANTSMNWEGGGIQVHQDSHLDMSGSWVVGNAALGNDAGGIGSNNAESVYIENSIIAGNTAGGTGGGLWGGRLYRIVNSHIVGNEAEYDGAAIAGGEALIEITNTLVINNIGDTGIDSQWDSGAVFLLSYCDTYGNSPDGTDGVTITRTNCLGEPPEDGVDPLMAGGALPDGVGPDYAEQWLDYDYRLLPGSPAINAGTPAGAPATDIEGNPRDATPDLGAYEVIHVEVSIDIKPGGDPNSINCSNANGVITVAILTTDTFDATTVDHTTVSFEGASETHVNKKTGEPIRHLEDVDLDGDMDLVFHFGFGDTTLSCESMEGSLTGKTFDGQTIQGTDAVQMISPGKPTPTPTPGPYSASMVNAANLPQAVSVYSLLSLGLFIGLVLVVGVPSQWTDRRNR